VTVKCNKHLGCSSCDSFPELNWDHDGYMAIFYEVRMILLYSFETNFAF
jgi:hypothetical protein